MKQHAAPLLAGGFAIALAVGGTAAAGSAPAVAAETETSPKNVIVLIGDGMGYNHIDFLNAQTTGETHWQVERGGDDKVIPSGQNTDPTEGWQSWNHLGMSTNWHDGPVYDPAKSWSDFEWNKDNPTDSAAAGTAMATGVKTYNAGIGVDMAGAEVENLSERAQQLGKSAGVVSSVPFSHATPAAYSSHDESRNNYHSIANQQVTGDLDVVIGAGHPFYDDNHQPMTQGDFSYISQADWEAVSTGQTDRAFLESRADFEALTTGETPEKVFGVPQVGSTLQQGRDSGAPMNDVPNLATLAQGAINTLDANEEGFFLMVEGGAIDWTGHANESDRNLEEVADFDTAVDSVIDWVETNSNWDETLVVVTADHETGYLYGEQEGDFSSIIPAGADAEEGTLPTHTWNSDNHTNQLVPFFTKGAGTDQLNALGTGLDLVRGHYLDNTSMAAWLLDDAWAVAEEPEPPAADADADAGGAADAAGTADAGAAADAAGGADGSAGAGADGAAGVGGAADGGDTAAGASGGADSGGQVETSAKGGNLARTGAESLALPIGLAAGALVLVGGVLLALRARKGASIE
ncbi:alkaline phosphatase [Leucobacter tardus]|uniref:Alkaline phosphatase n=1 Tax=Leucobacter tardus TaxID=501483 RepID=A0A939QEA5_9MICO|nr:alkaline phosphatase [Leucobacter tardus]MBO2990271.1 alkaline phosphatase [Leucobacter tardus]